MYSVIKKIIFPVLVFISAIILVIYLICHLRPEENINYTLKSYKNSVALFENEKLIKIYDSIVLNTLPEKDIQNFNRGFSVPTQECAEIILEDFDG